MMQLLLSLDRSIFEFVNGALGNPVFDAVLPWCREKLFWLPLYVFIGVFAAVNYSRRFFLAVLLGAFFSAGMADFTSSSIVKPNVMRLRPCNDPAFREAVELRVSCGSGFSFTSSHAANHFAVAVFLIGAFGALGRWVRPVLLGWAALIAFSQVYVGVHYPADVLCGAVLGSLLGWAVLMLWRKWRLV